MIAKKEDMQGRLFDAPYEQGHHKARARLAKVGAMLNASSAPLKVPGEFTSADEADLAVTQEQRERCMNELQRIKAKVIKYELVADGDEQIYAPKSLWNKLCIGLTTAGIAVSLFSLFGQPFSWAEMNFNVSETPLPSIAMAAPIFLMGFGLKIFVQLLNTRNARPHLIITAAALIFGALYIGLFDHYFVFKEITTVDGFDEIVTKVKQHGLFLSGVFCELGLCFALTTALGMAIRPKKTAEALEAETDLPVVRAEFDAACERHDDLLRKEIDLSERRAAYRAYVKDLSDD